jgi:hypothetical protein
MLPHDTNDNPRQDFDINVTQHSVTIPATLFLISFSFLIKYFDVSVINITMCLAKGVTSQS